MNCHRVSCRSLQAACRMALSSCIRDHILGAEYKLDEACSATIYLSISTSQASRSGRLADGHEPVRESAVAVPGYTVRHIVGVAPSPQLRISTQLHVETCDDTHIKHE